MLDAVDLEAVLDAYDQLDLGGSDLRESVLGLIGVRRPRVLITERGSDDTKYAAAPGSFWKHPTPAPKAGPTNGP